MLRVGAVGDHGSWAICDIVSTMRPCAQSTPPSVPSSPSERSSRGVHRGTGGGVSECWEQESRLARSEESQRGTRTRARSVSRGRGGVSAATEGHGGAVGPEERGETAGVRL